MHCYDHEIHICLHLWYYEYGLFVHTASLADCLHCYNTAWSGPESYCRNMLCFHDCYSKNYTVSDVHCSVENYDDRFNGIVY